MLSECSRPHFDQSGATSVGRTMKAIKVIDGAPLLVDAPLPVTEGVDVTVISSSICGSDLHLMSTGAFGNRIIGHEFAGVTGDGRAVAIEPLVGCGVCMLCSDGHRIHCDSGYSLMGIHVDGGMAERVTVPAANLVELPSGLDVGVASLVEPLAVAVHGLDRARVQQHDRVLVIGAGPIGLAVCAVLRSRGMTFDASARHDHQRAAAERLGAGLTPSGIYDVVVDAVGSSASLEQAVHWVRPMGRIGLVGVFWEDTELVRKFCGKEPELLPSAGYRCTSPTRNFDEAGSLLHDYPDVASTLVTHRFPLDAVSEAFEAAADRAGGAIKVVFEVARDPR